MNTFLPHTFVSDKDDNSNVIRGSALSEKVYSSIKESEIQNSTFGKNSKDVIEFSVYSLSGEIFGWKLVESFPEYINKQINYTNLDGENSSTSFSFLNSMFVTDANGEIIISPRHELEELGIGPGNYKTRISFKTDVVGSFENSTKLVIEEISQSRTEIKASTSSFKNSRNPNDISFNFEYNNFIRKRVLVAHISTHIENLLKNKSFTDNKTIDAIKSKTSDYDFYINKINEEITLDEMSTLRELNQIYTTLKDFYFNLLLSQYNKTTSKEDLYTDYINSVDYILNTYPRFVQDELVQIKLFYKYMLIQMLDQDILDSIFHDRFDKYLVNEINFGNGVSFPILKYKTYTDENKPENCNDTILIKTIEPIPEFIDVKSKFYISNISHSDDIIKDISIRDTSEVPTFKLRGPDISTKVSVDTTKEYTLSGDTALLKEDLSSAENLFNTTGKDIDEIQVDFSDFKNFVKFSSARNRLDNFVVKLSNISKITKKLNNLYHDIDKLNIDVANGLIEESVARDSIMIMENDDIKKLTKEHTSVLKSLTPYEKFLYYEGGSESWPRETSFTLSGLVGNVSVANGKYSLHASKKYDTDKVFRNEKDGSWNIFFDTTNGKWKLFNKNSDFFIYSNTSNLNSGFSAGEDNHKGFENQNSHFQKVYLEDSYKSDSPFTPPELIPSDVSEFKKTEGFLWYESVAKKANQYDKYNDDSLSNSIPEFLRRTDENEDFLVFLNMIGEQFDTLLVYIEAMSNMSYIRNSFSKGVPNQLVWFVMNSLGANFVGREVDELSISKRFEKNRDTVWRRILNNLPYILKTTGTENSIRALFKCYGVPDYLFQIREYGGINYGSDDFSDDATYKLDVYDYCLNFTETNQYIKIPTPKTKERKDFSIEFKLEVDPIIFKKYENPKTFSTTNAGTLPANTGASVDITDILTEDDFIIGSEKKYFFSKQKNTKSYRPHDWTDDFTSISWKNFREGISFSFPKVKSGTEPAFMTIYSDLGKRSDGTYDPLYTLAEVGAQETLNGNIVRLSFNKDDVHQHTKDFFIDFIFNGTPSGTHFTISELRQTGSYINNYGHFPILSSNKWEFGIYRDENSFLKNYGKFYFTLNNSDGTLYCPDFQSNPIYFDKDIKYNILIKRTNGYSNNDSGIYINVKKVSDSIVRYDESGLNILSNLSLDHYLNTENLFFGNKNFESFLGTLDRLRVYECDITNERFLNHINFNESYDIENPENLKESILTKVNFDYPYDISPQYKDETGERYGIIKNYSLKNNPDIHTYNFVSKKYPFDFKGISRREYAKIPGYGSKSFSNDKIRIETQTLKSTLSPYSRSTTKSSDRYSVDNNTLGVYFSPTDLINREIIRFFGNFRLSDYIGDPRDTDKSKYKQLESFKRIFFDNKFGKSDIQKYFNIIKSYIDPSIFQNLDKIVPARVNLVSGLLIEPNILERQKIPIPRIDTHTWVDENTNQLKEKNITDFISFKFNVGPKRQNVSSFANSRTYINYKESDVSMLSTEISTKNKNKKSTIQYNYSGALVGEQISDKVRDIFSVGGCNITQNGIYKIEISEQELSKATEYNGKYINYDIFLNEGIEVTGLTDEMADANGIYEFKFRGQSGLPVFCDDERIWWVFYSNAKGSWILASDGEKNGAKYIATGQQKTFTNYKWISGNEINYKENVTSPMWFSSGFNFSLPHGNLDKAKKDFFATVSSIASYNKFLEIDARLNGWVNVNISGIYYGSYIERTLNSDGTFIDKSFKKQEYKFSGEKKYVYLNGNFKGMVQKGWLGDPKLNQTKIEKTLKIIGIVNGENFESCSEPLYISGEINSLKFLKKDDNILLSYDNYESDVKIQTKKFKSINLIRVPSSLKITDSIKFDFYDHYKVENRGTRSLKNYTTGVYKQKYNFKTENIFYSPDIWSIDLKYNVSVKSSSPFEVKVAYTNIKLKNYNKTHKISDLLLNIKTTESEFTIDIINQGGWFNPNMVYNESGELINTDSQKYLSQLISNENLIEDFDVSNYIKELNKNKVENCFVVIKNPDNEIELVLIFILEANYHFDNRIDSKNFLFNTKSIKKQSNYFFEKTPIQINKVSNYIKELVLEFGGKGYTGNEFAYLSGEKPNNWKDTWPHKIKISDLFIIDKFDGKLLKPNYSHYIFTGLHWKNDKTIFFTSNPNLVFDSPDADDKTYVIKKSARGYIISGIPTPKIQQSVRINSIGNLRLGDTIGKPLEQADEGTFFRTKSSIKYGIGRVYDKTMQIQSNINQKVIPQKNTEVILLDINSLSEFEIYPKIEETNTLRVDSCGDAIPVDSDTYDIQILNFENKEITYRENGIIVNNFFGIFNEDEYESNRTLLKSETHTSDLISDYENRISNGYIRISGFYGDVENANGKYNLAYDISYCGEEKTTIPTYINENKKWVLLYDINNESWMIRSVYNKKVFISSNTKNLKDGFTATMYNNQGFFSGSEVYIKDNWSVDKNGIVFNEDNKIVGRKFQSASVGVHNKFKIVPNTLYFKSISEKMGTFLCWKIRIKSRKDSTKIYDIPVVYMNTDENDDMVTQKSELIDGELRNLKILQTYDLDYCEVTNKNPLKWNIVSSDSGALSSDNIKIRTYGETYLESTLFDFNDVNNLENIFEGEYINLYGNLINKNNCRLKYSEIQNKWMIESDDKYSVLFKNENYPSVGTYKTDTRNMRGSAEFILFGSSEIAIEVSNFLEDYEMANGIYRQVGYIDTGECLFKNTNGWVFYKEDDEWRIKNSVKYASLTISLIENIEETGVYISNDYSTKLFINFKLKFHFKDARDFLNVDIDKCELTGQSGTYSLFSNLGIIKNPSNDLDLNVKLSSTIATKKNVYRHTIPMETTKTIEKFSRFDNLIFKTKLDVFSDNSNDRAGLTFYTSDTKNTNESTTTSYIDLSKIVSGNINELYTNDWKENKNYLTGDIVHYDKKMYRCKKATPTERGINPYENPNRDDYWEVVDSSYYLNINVNCDLNVKKTQYEMIKKDDLFVSQIEKEFAKNFISSNEKKNGIVTPYLISKEQVYSAEKKYQPYDLFKVGRTKNTLKHGTLKFHTNKVCARKLKRMSVNDENTTISKSGILSGTPSIVRMFKKRETGNATDDSFWFNEDKRADSYLNEELVGVNPSVEPVVSFDFETHIEIKSIKLVIEGFESDLTKSANGEYTQLNRKFKDYSVFENQSGWILYNAVEHWVLTDSSDIDDASLNNPNGKWTTSDSDMLGSNLNGNNGTSSEFLNEVGYIHIMYEDMQTPTPTPTPLSKPTPTPTNENTGSNLETPTPIAQPTPTPTISQTTTNTNESVIDYDKFLFTYEEFAITKVKYDLSEDPDKIEKIIIEELGQSGHDVIEIVTLESLLFNKFILEKIPNDINSFNIKVSKYSLLQNETYLLKDLSEYGWDSSNKLLNGRFRPFYLSRNSEGRKHLYNGKSPFLNENFYLKSWPSKRNVLVKLRTDVTRITELSASKGKPTDITIKWKPTSDAKYVKIDYRLSTSENWNTLVDNLSQTYAMYGYRHENPPRGVEIYYKITSVGENKKMVSSPEVVGWCLDIPNKVLDVSASRGTYGKLIKLDWNLPKNETKYNATEYFSVLRSKSNDFSSYATYDVILTDMNTHIVSEQQTSYSYEDADERLIPGEIYWYKIVSHNEVTENFNDYEYSTKRVWSNSFSGFIPA